VGAGKAAASMARAVEAHWPSSKPLSGRIVTRYGHGVGTLKRIEVVEGAHPIPDAAGQKAEQILDLAKGLGPISPSA
jgi:glycerate 2-kinase